MTTYRVKVAYEETFVLHGVDLEGVPEDEREEHLSAAISCGDLQLRREDRLENRIDIIEVEEEDNGQEDQQDGDAGPGAGGADA